MSALLRSAHPGPAVAVTVVAGLLARSADLSAARVALVVAAVLTGQLVIGWSNDLVDAARDRAVHRTDKPLAAGEVEPRTVRAACAAALVVTVPLSLSCGAAAGTVHVLCVVGSGWLYNVRLKSSVWSWLPYAVAFGALPAVVTLAQAPPSLPPWWMPVAGALLGVGAHLVNALPDLADDAATGVSGLPHRIGARRAAPLATAALASASLVTCAAIRAERPSLVWPLVGVAAAVLALSVVALRGQGRTPFRAAMAIAVVDVALLAGAR
ncbi:MAG TPA: UbiA family prenyltransferase [Nocardioidaceae bacterium]|nr:UbiA family prenyltransferase [Nocardioidaceae bacterium]